RHRIVGGRLLMNPLIWVYLDPQDFLFRAAIVVVTATVVLLAVNAYRERNRPNRKGWRRETTGRTAVPPWGGAVLAFQPSSGAVCHPHQKTCRPEGSSSSWRLSAWSSGTTVRGTPRSVVRSASDRPKLTGRSRRASASGRAALASLRMTQSAGDRSTAMVATT